MAAAAGAAQEVAVSEQFAAWLAAPDDCAAAAVLDARLDTTAQLAECRGWLPVASQAFAALQESSAALHVRRLSRVLEAVQKEACRSEQEPPPQEPPPAEVAAWVAAMMSCADAARVAQRSAAVDLWLWMRRPGQHPSVAAAAAHAFASAAADGRTDTDALVVLRCFGLRDQNDEGDAACASTIAAVPGCCAALLALVTAEEEEGGDDSCTDACLALQAVCIDRDSFAALLRMGVVEACLACVATRSWRRCSAAVGLLVAVAEGGAWQQLSAAGAFARVLSAPALRPGVPLRLTHATLSFLVAAAKAATEVHRAAAAEMPGADRVAGVPRDLKAVFHLRAMVSSAVPGGFWAAVACHAAASPTALAALADAHWQRGPRAQPDLLSLLARCGKHHASITALAHAALLSPSWPVAPLLACGGAQLTVTMARGAQDGYEALSLCKRTLFTMMRAWAGDGAAALLTSPPPGPPALAAAVSAALLAPRMPHLGALLSQQAQQAAPALAAALLDAAAALAQRAQAAVACCECGADATSDADYRFSALCAAVGTLAAEAFPAPAAACGGAAAVPAGTPMYWTDTTRVVVPFEWRRSQPLRQPQHAAVGTDAATAAGGAKRKRSDSGSEEESSDSDGSGDAACGASGLSRRRSRGLLRRADVDKPLHGCLPFLVGGSTVYALGLAMQRASPVLADAIGACGGGSCTAPIPLPAMHDAPAAQHHALFVAAVEHADTGSVRDLPDESLQPLWRLAHALAMARLKRWCARRLAFQLRAQPAALFEAFEMSQTHSCGALEAQCARGLLAHLGALSAPITLPVAAAAAQLPGRQAKRDAAVALASLATQRPHALQTALACALTDALHELFGPPRAAAAAGALLATR
jgi:hypothetical protein